MTEAAVEGIYAGLPLIFEENRGQTDAQVHYLARGPGYVLFLTGDEAVLSLKGPTDPGRSPALTRRPEPAGRTGHDVGANTAFEASTATLRLSLSGARRNVPPTAEVPQTGRSNYFVGNDPEKWTTDVSHYGRVRYQDVYPGIDLVYYGNQRQLEYDFVVAPNADPEPIRLAFQGARKAHLDESGNLLLDVDGREVVQLAPVVYQEIGGRRVAVTGGYVLGKRETEDAPIEVALVLGGYDRGHALVIDPVLVYSTYISGSDFDEVKSLALDAAGNLYAMGHTYSVDFPVVGGLPPEQGGEPNPGSLDVFVAKLNPQGDALVYSTYLSGNGSEFASALKVDDQGAAYVAGSTSSTDFPVVVGLPPDQAGVPDGLPSAFVAKLNAAGDALVYSTYLAAGGGGDEAYALDLDSSGNAYLAGFTSPPYLFPIIDGLPPEQGGLPAGDGAIFIAKLNPTGDALVYSTYLSGSDFEWAAALAVDDLGQAYLGGLTYSLNLPRVGGLPADQGGEPSDSENAYFAKLNAEGNGLIYSTYLGGSTTDYGDVLTIDAAGNLYVAGRTASLDFPVVGGLPPEQGGQPVGGCCVDIFVAKLNPEGNALVYSTYLAGDWIDGAYGLVVDELGQAYLTGQTNSTNFPQVNGLPLDQGGYAPVDDGGPFGPVVCAFASKLNPSGDALMFSTYLCGNNTAWAIARGSNGDIYVAGNTGTAGLYPFPIVGGLPPGQGGVPLGGAEGFIAKLTEDTALVSLESARYSVSEDDGSIDVTVTRVGLPGEPVVVDFATADGTATAGSDYQESSGTLTWGSADMTPRIIGIPVFGDGVVEGDETFTLTLSNAAGAVIGTPTTATVLITDSSETEVFTATALLVDPAPLGSDGNGMFEPAETVQVAPAWLNNDTATQALTGAASNFIGPAGADYALASDTADYGSIDPGQTASCQETGTCYEVSVDDPDIRPATHWEATFDETLSDTDGTTKTWTLHIGDSFVDVARTSGFYSPIETLLHHGITGGCSSAEYCPSARNTRAQMPVFVLRALEGGDYEPPACVEGSEVFGDVPAGHTFCPWIEELANRGVVSGCGGGNYCPSAPVTRGQMAIFLLKTLEGSDYTPPVCTGLFVDVACPSSTFADWIEELYNREVTGGCGTEPLRYCPANPVNRQQMAVFVTRTFGLTLYGP